MRVTLTCEVRADNGNWVGKSEMFDSEQIRASNIDLLNYKFSQMEKLVNERVDAINSAFREMQP